MKKSIFDEITIDGLKIKNRLFRSAVLEEKAIDNGKITKRYVEALEELAKGGAGAIITGMMGIGINSRLVPGMVDVRDKEFIPDFKNVVNTVHNYDTKIIVQLSHCGVKSSVIDKGDSPLGPSDIHILKDLPAKAMSIDDIKGVIEDFGISAAICREAGADAIEIHGAHGYLISQFLSPFFNKREDEYGGSIENRSRLLFETYDEIRKKVGNDYPVFIKINYTDLIEPPMSMTSEESKWICKELEKKGISAFELSCGIGNGRETSPSRKIAGESGEGYFAEYAIDLADTVKTPVISVGGFRNPVIMDEWLNKGNIKAIAIARPLIREPELPNRWKNGENVLPECISCSRCFITIKDYGCPQIQKVE